jgi:hypothetical protein
MDSYVPLGPFWYIYLSASFPVSWQIGCNIQRQSSFGIFIVFTVYGVKRFNYYSVIDYPVLFCSNVKVQRGLSGVKSGVQVFILFINLNKTQFFNLKKNSIELLS